MPESAIAALDPLRRARLEALGYELLSLRPSPSAEVQRTAGRVRAIAVQGVDAAAPTPLLRAVVTALGLQPSDLRHSATPGVPVLAFGGEAGTADYLLPSLERLRSASGKRAAWPTLRALRRRLAISESE